MPRVKLCEKYCKPKVPPPNYISELLRRYKKATGLSDDEIAAKLKVSRKTANVKLNQKPEKWKISDLVNYCGVLQVPFSEALEAIGGSIGRRTTI